MAKPYRFAEVLNFRKTFSRVTEEHHTRRPTDVVRILVALVVVTFLATRVGKATPTERSIFSLFNTLPASIKPFASILYRVGALWAVALVTISALGAKRWRLARDLSLSGVLAWIASRGVGLFVAEGRHGTRAALRLGVTPTFPLVHLCVIVAILTAASPYVARPIRRVGYVLVACVSASAMYLGTAFPRDIVAGLFMGWGLAAAIHLVFGSPGGSPTVAVVSRALSEAGLQVADLRVESVQTQGLTVMVGTSDGKPVRVKLIGRDEADAQLLSRIWRFMVYRDSGTHFFLTRVGQLNQEAFITLLARDGGVRAPRVLLAGSIGPRIAVEVEEVISGTYLEDCEPASISDEHILQAWRQLKRLHGIRISHGRLDGRHIIIDNQSDKPIAFVDFGNASLPTSDERQWIDAAELLLATSFVVGERKAVELAHASLADEGLISAAPFLQQAAIGPTGRDAAASRKDLGERLDGLRAHVAEITHTEEPPLLRLQRVSTSGLLLTFGALFAVVSLLAQIGNPTLLFRAVQQARPSWVALAIVLSFATGVGYAAALSGSVTRKIPLFQNLILQVAGTFSNVAVPVGSTGLQIRFLQKQGLPLARAVAGAGVLCNSGLVAMQLVVLPIALWLSPRSLQFGSHELEGIGTVLGYIAAAFLVAVLLILVVPLVRRRVVPPITDALSVIWAALHSPRQLSLLVAGNLLVVILNACCLLACLEAFGHPVSIWPLLAMGSIVSTLSALVPLPGGGTAVSSLGLSGALVALGTPDTVAVAAVLTFQLVSSYVPAIPGWFATAYLVNRDYL